MGAIYICPEKVTIPKSVLEVFAKKGFSEPNVYTIKDLKILIYKKQFFNSINTITGGENKLFVIGTCFYKNKNYEDGLNSLLQDLSAGKVEMDSIYGSYLLLFWNNKELQFFTDKAGVQTVFFNENSGIISSSFLATIVGVASELGKLKVNKPALTETLVTGSLIGPETIIESITRYEIALHNTLPNIKKFNVVKSVAGKQIAKTFDAEVNDQLNTLNNYFDSIRSPLCNFGVVSGLTGGFDSRLLFIAAHKNKIPLQVYTNSINPESQQIKISKKLATAYNYVLDTPKQSGAKQNLEDNFYFNDGLIRIYQIWLEEVKSKTYLKQIYKEKLVSFSGVGGEQYRNSDHLIHDRYNFENWISAELITKYSGDVFNSSVSKKQIIKNIKQKIRSVINTEAENTITSFEIKKYNNEVYNSANRVTRNNIENQLIFFLSPFTENVVATNAYNAFNFLGKDHAFEKEMIFKLAPDISNIEIDYGYKISEKTPLKYTAISIAKSFVGLKLYNKFYFSKKKQKISMLFSSIANSNEYLALVDKLNLPIDLLKIKNNELLSPLLIETGFFLKQMDEHIRYD